MAARNHIQFECPRCFATVKADPHDSGKRVDCPNCEFSLLVPSQSLNQDLFDDIFESLDSGKSEPKNDPGKEPPLPSPPTRKKAVARNRALPKPEVQPDPDQLSTKPRQKKSPPAADDPDSKDIVGELVDVVAAPESAAPVPKDPFAIDPDTPLKIDGIGDLFSSDDVYGVKCRVCDTRIHVSHTQVGTEVECPICYSRVKVTPPEKNPKSEQRWLQPKPEKSHVKLDDELRLSDPIERPKVEIPIDESFGLEPVADDLLAPRKADSDPEVVPKVEVIEIGKAARKDSAQRPPTHLPSERKSRREKYEEVQRRQKEHEKPRIWRRKTANGPSQSKPDTHQGFPEFRFVRPTRAVLDMFQSHGLRWRSAVAVFLIGVGNAIMQAIGLSYQNLEEPALGDWILNTFAWLFIGGLPYLAGVLVLLYVCGYVFREAAYGNRQVFDWKTSGWPELTSTFLLFAFSFIIAGLPMLFLPLLVMPARFLLAPPMLLGAWLNKSPFAIVAVDAFQNLSSDAQQWRNFYLNVGILIVISMLARLAIGVSIPIVSVLTSFLGAALYVAVTIAFAAITGWHCGRIVQRLENGSQ